MQELKKEFQSGGFAHKQVMREDDVAIYRRTKQVEDRAIEHFEVVIIRVSPEDLVFGKTIPAHEKYPGSEQWGLYGWTCPDLDAAWVRGRKILKAREEKAAQRSCA